jgi:hypothetical protein
MSFKVGDRVRVVKRYTFTGCPQVGDEGAVTAIFGDHRGPAVLMDNPRGNKTRTENDADYHWTFSDATSALELVGRKDSPRVGDTVRVVLEGKVGLVRGDAYFTMDDNVTGMAFGDYVKSIEIIKPAKPSVADLPTWTVIQAETPYNGTVEMHKSADGKWRGIDDSQNGVTFLDQVIDRDHRWAVLHNPEKSNG